LYEKQGVQAVKIVRELSKPVIAQTAPTSFAAVRSIFISHNKLLNHTIFAFIGLFLKD